MRIGTKPRRPVIRSGDGAEPKPPPSRSAERPLFLHGPRLRPGGSRQALDHSRRPTSLLGDLRLLLLDEITGGLITVQAAQDPHRHAPVRGAAAVRDDDVEQNGARSCGRDFTRLAMPSCYAGKLGCTRPAE